MGDPFVIWLEANTNELISNDELHHIDHLDAVTFRPPNAACVSSKVILCAESARLSLADDSDEDDDFLKLEFFNVSQVIRKTSAMNKDMCDLPTLYEQDA